MKVKFARIHEEEEGICPACRNSFSYGDDECKEDYSLVFSWECMSCGQIGEEVHEYSFSRQEYYEMELRTQW